MPEETPSPYIIDGLLVNLSIMYTSPTTMAVEYKVKPVPYFSIFFIAVCVFITFFLLRDVSCFFIGLTASVILLSFVITERSYQYEFDKERQEIRRKWIGFQGIYIDHRKDDTYPLNELSYICVQLAGLHGNVFKLKAVFQNRNEISLPYGVHTLAQCMKVANMYRDFLEISAPIKLPD